MRRLRVEMPLDDFIRLKGGGGEIYRAVESFTVVQILRAGPQGAASIVQIRPRDSRMEFEQLSRISHVDLQLLDRDGTTFTCLMKVRPSSAIYRHLGLKRDPGYIVPPMEVRGDRAVLTFAGSSAGVNQFLAALRRHGLRYRVVSISDYRLSPNSPLNALTEKQRRVVSAAYQQGYYDRPRRASSQTIARALGLSSSTLVNHRLKAERRILSEILGRESPLPGV